MQLINSTTINQTYHFQLSNLSETIFKRECVGNNWFTAECVNKYFCPQLTSYFINVGTFLLVGTLCILWFNWFFFNHAYKWIDYDKGSRFGKFVGDLDNRETRAYWDMFIKEKLIEAFLLYTAFVVYLNI